MLFYRITGLFPEACSNVLKMNEGNVLVELAQILQDFPKNLWRKISENFIEAFLSKETSLRYTRMERIYYASKRIKSNRNKDFLEISKDMGVSSRQLERDFKSVLGITPKEYQRITRFQLALKLMKHKDPSHAAVIAGYFDQSHMTKEFKKMSLWTPSQSSIHVEDLLSNMDYRNYS
jgi:AraC-like DNA-binding protein